MEDQEPCEALFTGGLTYGTDGSRRLLLDVLRPATTSVARPMVLFVHGGGWHEGDRGAGMHPWLSPFLVAQGTATGQDRVRAVALSACPADLRTERLDSGNEVARLIGPDAGVDALAAASPICHDHPAAPPVMPAHGSRDEVVPIAQSLAFRDVLVSAGVEVQWFPIDDAPHDWADRPGRGDGTETAGTFGAPALPFFREHL